MGNGNVNDCAQRLHDELLKVIDKISPERIVSSTNQRTYCEPWMSKGLRKSSKKQLQLYKKYLSEKSTILHEKYKQYRDCFKKIKRNAKQEYYLSKCREFKTNTKKLWQMINNVNNKTCNKMCIITCIKVANIEHTNGKIIANSLCTHFAEIGMTYSNRIKPSVTPIREYLNKIIPNSKNIFLNPTNKYEICKLIDELANKTSSGWDCISNKLLKKIKHHLYEPLAVLFNKSLETGIFPDIFKNADVVPLYKCGERNLTTNYRPISLLPTLSKLLEKVVYNRVYTFLDNTDQLYQSQYGFRSKHSCENAIQELLGRILKSSENKEYTDAIFLDLLKAFDSLEHYVLLEKMNIYGIRGIANEWFVNYL